MSYKYSSPRVGTLPLPVGSPWVEDFSWLLSVWLVHLPHNESQSQMDSLNMLIKARRRHCACTCAHSCAHTRGRLIGSWIAPLGRGPDCSSLIFEVTNSLSPSAASLSHSQTHTHTRALALHTHTYIRTCTPAVTSYFKYAIAGTCIHLCTINFEALLKQEHKHSTSSFLELCVKVWLPHLQF